MFLPRFRNPLWGVSSILAGLSSFMASNEESTGCIYANDSTRRRLAAESLTTNRQNKVFVQLFPHYKNTAAIKWPVNTAPSSCEFKQQEPLLSNKTSEHLDSVISDTSTTVVAPVDQLSVFSSRKHSLPTIDSKTTLVHTTDTNKAAVGIAATTSHSDAHYDIGTRAAAVDHTSNGSGLGPLTNTAGHATGSTTVMSQDIHMAHLGASAAVVTKDAAADSTFEMAPNNIIPVADASGICYRFVDTIRQWFPNKKQPKHEQRKQKLA